MKNLAGGAKVREVIEAIGLVFLWQIYFTIVCSIIIWTRQIQVMPLNKSWHEYNESLIQRGRILMDVSFLRSSNREIKNMNKVRLELHLNIHVHISSF
jgi:hypothetical protein